MKRILLLSDLHGKSPAVDKEDLDNVDFVLLAGDFTLGAKSINKFEREVEAIAAFFAPKKVYLIPGNNDLPYVLSYNYPESIFYFHDKIDLIDSEHGIVLIGFGGAKIGIRNVIAFTEEEIFNRLDALFKKQKEIFPNTKVIFFVHDPPYNTNCDKAFMRQHAGSESVRKIIEIYQPTLAVCGHIHESQGMDTIGITKIVNAGGHNQKKYAIIELDENEIHVEFKQPKHGEK